MGQEPSGPARSILFTQGPAGPVHGIAFSGDSQRLFAAGRDKAVHVWEVDLRGRGGPPIVTPTATLRWEISRATRGVINTLAVASRHHEIAIAGDSARNGGDVILFDERARQLKTSLPRNRDNQGRPGHQSAVTAIGYSPDQQQLASISEDGEVLLWIPDRPERKDWTPVQVVPAATTTLLSRKLAFVAPRVLAVEQSLDPRRVQGRAVALYTTDGTPRRLRPFESTPHTGRVTAIAKQPDGDRWATADKAGRVFLWRGTDAQRPVVLRSGGLPVDCLAFGPRGVLAVGTVALRKPNGRIEPSVVELWDINEARLLDRAVVSRTETCFAVAISPDGHLLATQDIATGRMAVYTLTDNAGGMVARPLSQEPVGFSGLGRSVRHAAFQGGYRIGLGGAAGLVDQTFDVERGDFRRVPPRRVSGPSLRAGSWSVQPPRQDTDRSVVLLRRAGRAHEIKLREARQGLHFSQAFLPGPGSEPAGIAIGTDSHAGIFVYRLPVGPNERPELIRYYRDHSHTVTSLSVSSDGRYLASGSMDQTVKVWPLAGFFDRDPVFRKHAAWGARFSLQNGRVVVSQVVPEGIAFARGLRDGDVLTAIQTMDAADRFLSADQPRDLLRVLDAQPIYQISRLFATRAGAELDLPLVTPAWEPLLTLFAASNDEWAVWTPTGYFDSSLAEGGDLFGWQFNLGRDVPPKVVKGAFLQKELERPDVIRRLLQAGSLDRALAAAQVPDAGSGVAQRASQAPEVRIVSPRIGDTLRDNATTPLVARVKLPNAARRDAYDVRASVGGRNLGTPKRTAQDAAGLTYEWSLESFDPLNQIEVLATERGRPALDAFYGQDRVFLRGDSRGSPVEKYKLHVFALACEAYQGDPKRGEFGPLDYTIDDVDAIVKSLRELEGESSFFELAPKPTILRDGEVTRSRVVQEIEQLAGRFSPVGKKDIVLVYLHGHGKAINDPQGDRRRREYFFVPIDVRRESELRSKGVSWAMLSEIAKRRCHVVWMIDTCESGVAAKSVLREAQRSMTLAIAAVPNEQETPEAKAFGGFGREGGTAFACSVLEAINGSADGYYEFNEVVQQRQDSKLVEQLVIEVRDDGDTDQRVSLAELVYYLRDAVPRKLREAGGDANEPRVAPKSLLNTCKQIQLVRTPAR